MERIHRGGFKRTGAEIVLGVNFDKTVSKLEPFVRLDDDVEVHPAHLDAYLKKREEEFKKK
jgi:hypothetical protein